MMIIYYNKANDNKTNNNHSIIKTSPFLSSSEINPP